MLYILIIPFIFLSVIILFFALFGQPKTNANSLYGKTSFGLAPF